jgi:hypothetical protein
MEKIVLGPTQVVLDLEEFPITFAALEVIKVYKSECDSANLRFSEKVREAQSQKEAALSLALSKLKGSLT